MIEDYSSYSDREFRDAIRAQQQKIVDSGPRILRVQVAHKVTPTGQLLLRVLTVRGNSVIGFKAYVESCHVTKDNDTYLAVLFDTPKCREPKDAIADALPAAIKEAISAGYTIDVE